MAKSSIRDNGTPDELRAEEWLQKAYDDELNAHSILTHRDGTPSGVCFLSHQMAEKLLKAFLVFTKNWYPKIHPLDALVEQCMELDATFTKLKDTAVTLDPYYTLARYPGDYPDFSWRDAEKAFAAALRIKKFVLQKLKTKT